MEVSNIIDDIVTRLKEIRGIVGIVLGGSRAKGTHTASSDIDIGIYYDNEDHFDISAIGKVATALDDNRRDSLVTPIGEWGPWINGGGWIKIHNYPVDFLFRDIRKVNDVVNACLDGSITIDYQAGHAHGFINAIYIGETANCRILWDPEGIIAELKSKTSPYPDILKNAIINRFLWEAAFSVIFTGKSISRIDVSHAAGYCFRAVSCLNQALFAKNKIYWMNETGAVDMIDKFIYAPPNYKQRVNQVFTLLSTDKEQMKEAITLLQGLIEDTEKIVR
jgi:predicted nucleotidyltransferase